MSAFRAGIMFFFIYLGLSLLSGWYSWTNPYFERQTYNSVLTDKWTEARAKNNGIRLMGRFEGTDNGTKFKYDISIGEYTYKHVPFGTAHTFQARPYDVHRDPTKFVLQVLSAVFSFASGLIAFIFGIGIFTELFKRYKERKKT